VKKAIVNITKQLLMRLLALPEDKYEIVDVRINNFDNTLELAIQSPLFDELPEIDENTEIPIARAQLVDGELKIYKPKKEDKGIYVSHDHGWMGRKSKGKDAP
jgi:hypothetical protein